MTTKIKLPRILDAYLLDGPFTDWLRFHQIMYTLLCTFIGILGWHFLAWHWFCLIVMPFFGYMSSGIFGFFAIMLTPYKVKIAELHAQALNPKGDKRVLEDYGTSYKLNVEDGVPYVVVARKMNHAQASEALELQTEAFKTYARMIQRGEVAEADMPKTLKYMNIIIEDMSEITKTEKKTWYPLNTVPGHYEVEFSNGESFLVPASIECVNVETGLTEVFDLIPGWEGDTILSGAALKEKIDSIEGVKVTSPVPYIFFDSEGAESHETLQTTYVLRK